MSSQTIDFPQKLAKINLFFKLPASSLYNYTHPTHLALSSAFQKFSLFYDQIFQLFKINANYSNKFSNPYQDVELQKFLQTQLPFHHNFLLNRFWNVELLRLFKFYFICQDRAETLSKEISKNDFAKLLDPNLINTAWNLCQACQDVLLDTSNYYWGPFSSSPSRTTLQLSQYCNEVEALLEAKEDQKQDVKEETKS